MASNDYYASFNAPRPPKKDDDPLPSLPPGASSNPSPFATPFDDHYASNNNHYPPTTMSGYQPSTLDTTTSYNSHLYQHEQPSSTDPFGDKNAIPMTSQHPKLDSSPTRYNTDTEGHQPRRRKSRKKGWFKGRVTWVVYVLTTVQIAVFVGELIRNAVLTGTPIALKPQFNYMIGPSPYVLINMGARYQPCMHNLKNVTDFRYNGSGLAVPFACPNSTRVEDFTCSLSQLCGFGGVPYQEPGTKLTDRSNEPNQWWRFIIPLFLHGGLIHIGFNMLLQWTLGRDMEKELGSWRFALIYFCCGIFGNVFGGNYGTPASPSTGASGSLFGILGLHILDLLYNWGTRRSPVKDLLFLVLDIAIAFVLGLIPGFLDNFSHMGGLVMGLVLGICLMHSPPMLRERIGVDEPPYATVDTQPLNSGASPGMKKLVSQPIGFFKGRKPFWWVWWLFRAGCLVAVLIGFILLLDRFYDPNKAECKWCHHLSCLPVKNWCDIGAFRPNVTEVTQTPQPTPAPTNPAFFL